MLTGLMGTGLLSDVGVGDVPVGLIGLSHRGAKWIDIWRQRQEDQLIFCKSFAVCRQCSWVEWRSPPLCHMMEAIEREMCSQRDASVPADK